MGSIRLDGTFDPESGEVIIAAVSPVVDAEARAADGDPRTPAQRRADALTDVCRSWLDRVDRPSVAGERPHVQVTVALDALEDGGPRATAELDRATAELGRDGSTTRVRRVGVPRGARRCL